MLHDYHLTDKVLMTITDVPVEVIWGKKDLVSSTLRIPGLFPYTNLVYIRMCLYTSEFYKI